MNLDARVQQLFDDSIRIKTAAAAVLITPIVQAAVQIAQCLHQGGKLLICGNGGSAADAQHFAAEFINRFECERPGLPALALTTDSSVLTAIANDYQFEQIFSKQIHALGNNNDVLLAISTSGQSPNILAAITAAHGHNMHIIALTGKNGGELALHLNKHDIELRVPSPSTARIQEVHILILHCLCDLVEYQLFNCASDKTGDA